ncbi:HNH endonuclease [Enterococcus faecalis]|uniref:HNH endonuclease n=1 Tax=Enterococcus faecalis TaxID=1351 RepID=UPI000DE892E3|nr:HNH endonuclease signature motif containing protein [Enterococcus faecalis]MDU7006813.1 HNH endonuclease signature motif containing protein [Enterococcus faecalis]HBC2896294.1 HNH endonuclease [Enterococcus faecalis]
MRYCQFEGCSNTTERGAYCSEHARSSRKKMKQGNVYHHENKSFYRTPAWRDMREVIYERDRGCCKRCGKFVFGRKAHVHHIVPIKNNPLLKLDPNNLILLCSECHPIVEQETETKKVFPSYF